MTLYGSSQSRKVPFARIYKEDRIAFYVREKADNIGSFEQSK